MRRRMFSAVVGTAIALLALPAAAGATGSHHQGGGDDEFHGPDKVTICHNGETKEVPKPAAWAHKRHGDTFGPCAPGTPVPPPDQQCPEPVPPCTMCPVVPGPVGPVGPEGPPGQTVVGPVGPVGPKGDPGQSGTTVVTQQVIREVAPPVCTSRRVAHLRIFVARGDRMRKLRTTFEGVKAPVKKVNRRTWVMTVDLRGLKKGVYAARITATVIHNGQPRKWFAIQMYRPCYGNPKGGKQESLNPAKTVRFFEPPRRREANP